MLYGIACGLAAALFQSLSYLATRHFVHVRSGGARMLLVLAHIWMGIASIALLPLVWPESGIPWRQVALPLFGTSFFYIVGQFGLMLALRRAQPSQVAPMLAFKLLVLATLALVVTHTHILPLQWLAIVFCVAGTIVLNYQPHDRLPSQTIAILLFVCFFYGLSDWNITYLVPAFGQIPRWRAIMCGSLLCYASCGIVAIPFLPAYGSRRWLDWRDALPFASAWLFAVLCLFTSFAIVGVIYGNILQATRSIMGVFLAALFTHLGHTHIEHLSSRAMFARRLTAAVLMTLALILWAASQPAPTPAAPVREVTPQAPIAGDTRE